MDEQPAEQAEYSGLAEYADRLFSECDEDAALLAEHLDALPGPIREGLLRSDFLNAFQVFYYYFRTMPGEIEADRLTLYPASELQYGIRIAEIELLDVIVAVIRGNPCIIISDGKQELARFSGPGAYREALDAVGSLL